MLASSNLGGGGGDHSALGQCYGLGCGGGGGATRYRGGCRRGWGRGQRRSRGRPAGGAGAPEVEEEVVSWRRGGAGCRCGKRRPRRRRGNHTLPLSHDTSLSKNDRPLSKK
jgi:hypothetical protein